MEPFFLISRNVVHACGFSRVQSYTDQEVSSLSDFFFFFSLNIIVTVVSLIRNYTLTSKHRIIIAITTTEQYFSPLPEKYRYLSISYNFTACYHKHISLVV